jgi:urease gamma subunit
MAFGIKETVDVIEAVAVLKKVIVKHLADGFQTTDLVKVVEELLGDEKAKKEIGEALDGIELVLPELKDLTWAEKFELVQKVLQLIA